MPLVIKLKPGPYQIPWATEESASNFREVVTSRGYAKSAEDQRRFLEYLGGLENIIESVEWVE